MPIFSGSLSEMERINIPEIVEVDHLCSDGKSDEWDKRAGIPALCGPTGRSDWTILGGQRGGATSRFSS